jgi:hypothetical protein
VKDKRKKNNIAFADDFNLFATNQKNTGKLLDIVLAFEN